jgi:hypothetical protein
MAEFIFMLLIAIALTIAAGCGALLLTYFAYAGGQTAAEFVASLSDRAGAAFGNVTELLAQLRVETTLICPGPPAGLPLVRLRGLLSRSPPRHHGRRGLAPAGYS